MRKGLALLVAMTALLAGCGDYGSGDDRTRTTGGAATTQDNGSGGGYDYP